MKEKILHKATELFLNLGFKSVTMDDLASEIGISKKTIYQHYDNKTELVEASTFYLFDTICTGIDHICETASNPIEELYHIKRFVMEHLKNEKSSPQYQLKKYYPKIHDRLKWKQFEVMHENIVENLKEGIAQGIFRANLDVDFVSRMYFNGMSGIKDTELFPTGKHNMNSLMDTYLEYHLRAITTEKGLRILNDFINTNQS
ncbi:TetR/AcrR family transcriptional regulator [Sungkyunkwania multivorans]|uniref:TetR/AcrR family transcriptional regulator n=1 Tax=Sungkyunkwania multivorans TaxID=1173618 RepID=A0ABW3CYX1_9FLAO